MKVNLSGFQINKFEELEILFKQKIKKSNVEKSI